MYFSHGTTFATTYDNSLWAWGGGFGNVPVHIMNSAATVSVGTGNRNFVIQTDGSLWALSPDGMEFIMSDAAAVHSVDDVHFVIRTGGELVAWGRSHDGRLGEDTYVPQDSPITIR